MMSNNSYRFGDFRLDVSQRILERGDALVAVPPKVIETLVVLVEAAPRIVDKETLFNRVWPGTHVVESSLTRNMSVLRKVLGDEDGSKFIQTISKRGYRFVAPVITEGEGPADQTSPTPSKAAVPRPWIWAAGVSVALTLLLSLLALNRRDRSESPEAVESHKQYLIGRHLWNKGTPAQAEKALARFEDAIRLNPTDALAHAGKADALILLSSLGARTSSRTGQDAVESARIAVERGPQFGATHAVLGAAMLFSGFDWRAAEAEYRRAISLDPQSVRAYYGLSRLLAQTNRITEAKQTIQTAQYLDPVSPMIAVRAAYLTYSTGDFRSAEKQLLAVIEREPDYDPAHYYLGLIYGFLGEVDRGLEHLSKARLSRRTLQTDSAWVLAQNGKPAEAKRMLADFESLKRENRISRSAGTTLLVGIGAYDQAVASMNMAVSDRETWALDIGCDPRLRPVHNHPGFAEVRRRLGLLQ